MKTRIEKKRAAKGDRMEETEKLIKIASESLQEEKDMSDFMDMKYEEALKKFLKNMDSFALKYIRILHDLIGKVRLFLWLRVSKYHE